MRRATGPLLIVGAVLLVLHPFALGWPIRISHPDVLPFWLPTHCFLGESLAAGHIPLWNPHALGGAPFAGDPQSGWMYLPAMALYTALPCAAALRWFVVLQPLLSGLALYAFLRIEGLSRPAATVGGLALALPLASSVVGRSLPFAGSFAWTAVTLWCAARLLRSERWSGRLAWAAAAGAAWGQILSAHPSQGMLLGSLALGSYVTVRLVGDARAGRRSGGEAAAIGALLAACLSLVNLAILLPRLGFVPHSTLALPHPRLEAMSGVSSALADDASMGIDLRWPLGLAFAPGAFLGATALVLAPLAWLGARRPVRTVGAVVGGISLVLALRPVAESLTGPLGEERWANLALHLPGRMALGLFLAVPLLAATGLEAWRTYPHRGRAVAVAAATWVVLALLAGGEAARLLPFAIGAGLLFAAGRRPRRDALAVRLLTAELLAATFLVQPPSPAPPAHIPAPRFPLTPAATELDAYLEPGPIARAMLADPAHGRYASIEPPFHDERGPHVRQLPGDWGLMATQRSMLLGLEEAQGYNPAQPFGYWRYLLAIRRGSVRYNSATLDAVSPQTRDLLRIGWLVAPSTFPQEGGTPVATEGRWTLFRLPATPEASLVTTWSSVRSLDEALARVTATGFEPSYEAVVEGAVPLQRGTPEIRHRGKVRLQWTDAEHARAAIDAPSSGIVLVRMNWDPHWRARVDGRPAPVLRTDGFLIGVPVPGGARTMTLAFEDPSIGLGLAGSGLVLLLLLGGATLARTKEAREQQAPEKRGHEHGPGAAGVERPRGDPENGHDDQHRDRE